MRLVNAASLLALVVALAAAPVAVASDKKSKKDVSVDSFFDPPPAKRSDADDLKKAAAGLGAKDTTDTLAPRTGTVDAEADVKLHAVFAAEVIVLDKKFGCQPGGRRRERVTYWSFEDLPETGVPFQVCLNVSSKAGRQMSVTVSVVDPRNSRIVRAEDVIDFAGRTGRIDHVIEFPATTFKTPGMHQYLVEMDGKEVGRLPIFDVRVVAEGSPTGAGGEAAPTAP
ncbi:MAG: hypothetical protein FJ137_14365 [Deltaproteobacteria bacterium]|nr:hypothetical protein [Deltaproteobacteria bacterium]